MVALEFEDSSQARFAPRRSVPIPLTKFAKKLDDGTYAYFWYEEPGAPATADEDPAGVTSHF